MNEIVLASRNAGKIRELAVLLEPFGVKVSGLDAFPEIGEIEENGTTFVENALIKASTVSKLTGLVAVADDSGLVVDYLDGAPGVYSARYSAEPGKPATDAGNNEKLLERMRSIPQEKRGCRFVSVMAAYAPDGSSITAEGFWEGFLAESPKGENGFGYDPLFVDPETKSSAAEMSPSEKNSRSHRAKACAKLLELWPAFWDAAQHKAE